MYTTSDSTMRAVFFFFSSRRRHTRFDCDWSSDVCSSDLAAVHPLGAAFRSFDGKSLQAVAQEIIAFVFCFFGALADALAGRHDEKREMVTLSVLGRQEVIAQAEEIALALPGKAERVQGLFRAWRKQKQRSEERRVGKECRSRWSPYH